MPLYNGWYERKCCKGDDEDQFPGEVQEEGFQCCNGRTYKLAGLFCLFELMLSAGSVNFHAKLKIHSTWGSTDLDEIYKVCRLYRVYSIPKIFLKTIT